MKLKTLLTISYSLLILFVAVYTILSMQENAFGVVNLSRKMMIICLLFSVLHNVWFKIYSFSISNVLFVLSLLMVISISINMDAEKDINYYIYSILRCLFNISIFYCTYSYMRKYGFRTIIYVVYLLFFLALVVSYFQVNTYVLLYDDTQMIASYYVLFLLPILLLKESKLLCTILLCITMIALIAGFKRGGVLAFALSAIAYYVISFYSDMKKSRKNAQKIYAISGFFLLGILVAVVVWYLSANENPIIERIQNIENDEGSGRLTVWSTTWNMFCSSNIFEFVMGHGEGKVLTDSRLDLSAHNDFLEVAYDYGVIALIVYSCFVFVWIKFSFRTLLEKKYISSVSFFMLISFLFLSMISHIIIYPWMFLFCNNLGAICGLNDRDGTECCNNKKSNHLCE